MPPDTPAARLRQALQDMVVEAMSAHNPLCARLAAEAGFEAVWASGFELSASLCLPDANLVSMDQHLEVVRAMAQAIQAPIIADIDNGFGNAINVMHAVRRYEQAGAAAVVMEDKVFPKMTSLAQDVRQELVSIAEFQGKLEAARAARAPGEAPLVLVGRTEALIAGLGLEEALSRARAYAEAGADLILVHSKRSTPDEIEAFIARWDGEVPLALVPTAYPTFSRARARELGRVGLIIYGNHAIRAAVAAMQATFAAIRRDGHAAGVEGGIAPLDEMFRLQGMDELREAEAAFLK